MKKQLRKINLPTEITITHHFADGKILTGPLNGRAKLTEEVEAKVYEILVNGLMAKG